MAGARGPEQCETKDIELLHQHSGAEGMLVTTNSTLKGRSHRPKVVYAKQVDGR